MKFTASLWVIPIIIKVFVAYPLLAKESDPLLEKIIKIQWEMPKAGDVVQYCELLQYNFPFFQLIGINVYEVEVDLLFPQTEPHLVRAHLKKYEGLDDSVLRKIVHQNCKSDIESKSVAVTQVELPPAEEPNPSMIKTETEVADFEEIEGPARELPVIEMEPLKRDLADFQHLVVQRENVLRNIHQYGFVPVKSHSKDQLHKELNDITDSLRSRLDAVYFQELNSIDPHRNQWEPDRRIYAPQSLDLIGDIENKSSWLSRNSRSVAQIIVKYQNTLGQSVEDFCTGTLITAREILTNDHCFSKDPQITNYKVEAVFGKTSVVAQTQAFDCSQVLLRDRILDLAVISCSRHPGEKWGWVQLSDRPLKSGEAVYQISHPNDGSEKGDGFQRLSVGHLEIDEKRSYGASQKFRLEALTGSSGSLIFSRETNMAIAHFNSIGGTRTDAIANRMAFTLMLLKSKLPHLMTHQISYYGDRWKDQTIDFSESRRGGVQLVSSADLPLSHTSENVISTSHLYLPQTAFRNSSIVTVPDSLAVFSSAIGILNIKDSSWSLVATSGIQIEQPIAQQTCTGFNISPEVVWTNAHCVEDGFGTIDYYLNYRPGEEYRLQQSEHSCNSVLVFNRDLDMALLYCPSRPGGEGILKLASIDFERGDWAYNFHYAQKQPLEVSSGRIQNFVENLDVDFQMDFFSDEDAMKVTGASGSPLLNQHGEVSGYVLGSINVVQGGVSVNILGGNSVQRALQGPIRQQAPRVYQILQHNSAR